MSGWFDTIWADDLPSRAVTVYMYLRSRADREGKCFPSVRTISRDTKLSMSTVRRALDDLVNTVPFPVSWTVKMKKKQKETQDILSYHSQAAGCSDKARAKASGGRQPIEECGRTGL